MKIKKEIGRLLNKSAYFRAINYRRKIEKQHKNNTKKYISNKRKPIYYIIGFDDPQSCGWTVWERVVLYGAIYAEDHGMIAVVDMKNHRSIYQKEEEFGKVNIWDKYYLQPNGVTLEEALDSGNYVIADTSAEWFTYIRMRTPKRFNNEFLRKKYNQFIRLQPNVVEACENTLRNLVPNYNNDTRILSIKVRGTDYIKYQHSVQPNISEIVKIAKEKFEQCSCDYYYISTEDTQIFDALRNELPKERIISFNSGNVSNIDGFVGEHITKICGEEKASMDYITTLYILNKSCCLIGGVCGATIVAQYRRNPPYEYLNIIDLNEHY